MMGMGFGALVLLLAISPMATVSAATSAPSITVTPTAAIVGATITVAGTGFPPNATLSLQWPSVNAAWLVQPIPVPQVTGLKTSPVQTTLGSAQTNSSGGFSARLAVPTDYGGQHIIQAFFGNGTALPPKAVFVVEPSFHMSPTSGPDGTPIAVTATGLSYGTYSTSYHVAWDNSYTGYLTAVGSQGATNFTMYASGVPGVHYLDIYQGYPGPGYLNPQQGPPSSETQSVFGSYIPFYANFTVTPEQVLPSESSSTTVGMAAHGVIPGVGSLFLLLSFAGMGLFVTTRTKSQRKALSKLVMAAVIVVLVAVAGIGIYAATSGSTSTTTSTLSTSSSSSESTTTSQSSIPQVSFVPVATVYRPHVTVPVNNATTGPRISVSPTIASVGDNITVNGAGFAPNASLPLTWTTRQGSNLLGYKLVSKPLRQVTASSSGTFTLTMKVPPDLGGTHFIAAGNLTQNSNGTVFIQRSAVLSATQGPQGTKIQVVMHGVGWDFNTNIVTIDYDNSYIGYACGFNSGGNVTVTIVATGQPGIHTIDLYPSEWWGGSNFASQQVVEYRYPLLTPQDHPEQMPSFHFTFLMTSTTNSTQTAGVSSNGGLVTALGGASALESSALVASAAALFLFGPLNAKSGRWTERLSIFLQYPSSMRGR